MTLQSTEKTQSKRAIRCSSWKVDSVIQNISLWSGPSFVTLQIFLILKQKHYRLTKVEKVKKHNSFPLSEVN